MAGIYPIPSGRASDALLQRRLLAQLQFDQGRLLQTQDQISTGRLFSRPSQNPQAATRAITLQRVSEYQAQYQVNLNTTKSFLSASETAVSGVLDQVRSIQGNVLTAINSPTTDVERTAIVDELRNSLSFLVDVGNTQFRGRYLFSGQSNATIAYSKEGDKVVYEGSEFRLQSYADKSYLLDSNLTGTEVFGGLSAPEVSREDLNPSLSYATRLADLRDGRGIELGSVRLSDGFNDSVVNLKGSRTLGDVIQRLRSHAPGGRDLEVSVLGDHLELSWADGIGGVVSVEDLDGGRAAQDLRIHRFLSEAGSSIVGGGLEPQLSKLTQLSDLLGSRSSALVRSPGSDNDILIESLGNGADTNGTHIQWVDDELRDATAAVTKGDEYVEYSATARAASAGLTLTGSNNNLLLTANTAGTEFNHVEIKITSAGPVGDAAFASYDAASKQMTIAIDSTGATTVGTLVAAVNGEGTFTATYDASVASDGGYNPAALVNAADIGNIRTNTSQSGGEANTYFVYVNPQTSTANDVVAALNADAGFQQAFTASLDPFDGVNQESDGEGLVGFTNIGETAGGSGEDLDVDSGLKITMGAESFDVRLTGAKTVEDLINRVRSSGAPAVFDIDPDSNRFRLRSRASGVDFSIGEIGGTTATQLGLRSFHSETYLAELNHQLGVRSIEGTDFTIRRNDGVALEIDVSAAETIDDVLRLINDHPDNQDAERIEARLALTGNGIEIVDDNPPGTATLQIEASFGSFAAEDLGLIPVGETLGTPGGQPTPATLDVTFSPPDDEDNAFRLVGAVPGTELNGVDVIVVDGGALGDTASVVYDDMAKTLTVTIDPSATTAATVVSAIGNEGTFEAELTSDSGVNDGTGLIPVVGSLGVTAGGSSQPSALSAETSIRSAPPNELNSGFVVTAPQGGTFWNGVEIELVDSLAGDLATASYNSGTRRLTVQIDASATTASTVVAAINSEGTFLGALDVESDPGNDGSGLVTGTGVQGVLSGGTPEVLSGRDVNPLENRSVFDTVQRLINELSSDFDLRQVERLHASLQADLEKMGYSLAEVGARTRAIQVVEYRLEDSSINLQTALSEEIDVELVEAISNLSAQQASFQASLQMMGRSFQLSLLDFV